MRFSCPYQPYCGTQDLMTIVPTYDGIKREFKNSDKIPFKKDSLCRHRIKFPMDAVVTDKILFEVSSLKNVRLVMALGTSFSDDNIKEFLFTSKVNKNGGFIKFPYPYEGYMTINFDENTIGPLDGEYDFST